MKIAIISVSKKGKELSFKLKSLLDEDSTIILVDIYFKKVKKKMKHIFKEYDAIIGIMASGILIRSISTLINSKITDPAILNIDENANHVISLLSGHIGGANDLTRKVADLLNSEAVVTTATDVNNKIGMDVLARNLYYNIINPKEILNINKAILNSEKIVFKVNSTFDTSFILNYIKNNTLEIDLCFIYDEDIPQKQIYVIYEDHELILKERRIVLGIGCKQGKTQEEIMTGIKKAMNNLNMDISRINYISTAEIKRNEKGIIDIAKILDIPLEFVSIDKLKLFKSKEVHCSKFVKSKFGICGVCEPSAMIVAGFDSKLIYKKTAFNGVTIAIAVSK